MFYRCSPLHVRGAMSLTFTDIRSFKGLVDQKRQSCKEFPLTRFPSRSPTVSLSLPQDRVRKVLLAWLPRRVADAGGSSWCRISSSSLFQWSFKFCFNGAFDIWYLYRAILGKWSKAELYRDSEVPFLRILRAGDKLLRLGCVYYFSKLQRSLNRR